MNNALKEYLVSKDIHIDTNATDLVKMLKSWNKSKDWKKAFKDLFWKRNSEVRSTAQLLEYVQDNENDIKQLIGNANTVTDLAAKMVFEVVKIKTEFINAEKETKIQEVNSPEETIYKKKFVDKVIYSFEDVNLFETKTRIKPNQADVDFYSCFVTAGSNIMFKTDKMCRLIFQKMNGELDFKNELGIRNDKNEDALITVISNQFGAWYEKFMKCANAALTTITKEDIKNSAENGIPIIEDRFENGFVKDDEHFMFPSSFRKFADVKARYKRIATIKTDDETAEPKMSVPIFDGFVLKPTKGLKSFEFDDFLDYFAMNFRRLTMGCLKSFDDWKTFSNSYADAALNVMLLPDESVWKNAEMPDSWKSFFKGKASERILHRVYFFIGSCLDAKNKMQQILMIADNGRTGKGEMIRLLQRILPKGCMKSISNNVVDKQFTITSHALYKAHVLFNTEYDGKIINTEMMKQITGGDTISCEVKNGASIDWNTEGTKIIFTSNRICYMTENAIRGRIIPVTFVPNYEMNNQLNDEQKQKMVDDGQNFLNFCYREYMESPYRTNGGGFIVMNPEQEKTYLETGETTTPDKMGDFLLRAFSKDPDIGDKFKSGDISETHMNDEFEDIYNELFEFDENSYITVKDMKDAITELVNRNNDNKAEYYGCFDWFNIEDNNMLGNLNSVKNRRWAAFLEKTMGHDVNIVKKINNKTIRCVTKIKLKPLKEMSDEEFLMTDKWSSKHFKEVKLK